MPKVTVTNDFLFNVFLSDAERAYSNLKDDVLSSVERMKALGVTDKEIFSRLEKDLEDETGDFGAFKGRLGKTATDLLGTTGQVESNAAIKGSSELFVWELDPTAKEHCESCVAYATDGPKTWDEWAELGIPGAGNTECGHYCRCTLSPYTEK